jgi:hypothetical protein
VWDLRLWRRWKWLCSGLCNRVDYCWYKTFRRRMLSPSSGLKMGTCESARLDNPCPHAVPSLTIRRQEHAMKTYRRLYTGNVENKQEMVYCQCWKQARDGILSMLKTSKRLYTSNDENKHEMVYCQCLKQAEDCILAMLKTSRRLYTGNVENKH